MDGTDWTLVTVGAPSVVRRRCLSADARARREYLIRGWERVGRHLI